MVACDKGRTSQVDVPFNPIVVERHNSAAKLRPESFLAALLVCCMLCRQAGARHGCWLTQQGVRVADAASRVLQPSCICSTACVTRPHATQEGCYSKQSGAHGLGGGGLGGGLDSTNQSGEQKRKVTDQRAQSCFRSLAALLHAAACCAFRQVPGMPAEAAGRLTQRWSSQQAQCLQLGTRVHATQTGRRQCVGQGQRGSRARGWWRTGWGWPAISPGASQSKMHIPLKSHRSAATLRPQPLWQASCPAASSCKREMCLQLQQVSSRRAACSLACVTWPCAAQCQACTACWQPAQRVAHGLGGGGLGGGLDSRTRVRPVCERACVVKLEVSGSPASSFAELLQQQCSSQPARDMQLDTRHSAACHTDRQGARNATRGSRARGWWRTGWGWPATLPGTSQARMHVPLRVSDQQASYVAVQLACCVWLRVQDVLAAAASQEQACCVQPGTRHSAVCFSLPGMHCLLAASTTCGSRAGWWRAGWRPGQQNASETGLRTSMCGEA